jgi:hypothetical protein
VLETLAAGLILAAVSGLTYVAYKHPAGYQRLAMGILGVLGLAAMGILAYAFGGMWSMAGGLHDRLSDTTATLASEAFAVKTLYSGTRLTGIVLIISALVFYYLLLLTQLPAILRTADSQKKKKPPEDPGAATPDADRAE